ncbi:MAG TPA: Asp-tRNA(Asn)/Glu-tRNA(Gln) amidotransferase GatCAB subunit A [Candidatus Wildermuthbacteria bacterium]|uniref:Glutamyl-tRNA(Gln) amidotransferase subunit A n=1 Tax=Candidatus Yanofskybacteria bacterium GW2011_GWC1_48_11 TaxID=1619027 RepID=A0A837IP77_9BACT|nr:MAG: Glutamyl-tRNA(Gln) amidotransferase subunit A [Candidatus Yanofskybacteria bacterium GW2011_GWC1_48_11]KKW04610.1 MAG: Glutamyl-tRNA(Gln) amidotransferase subunit A [Parcubacteria group bacterium GW2011_GWB1_49_12]KKW09132.1 MAG: Glutamyl-tRNA(Gln) amidotransferase subunit A [Parcubacteria group bacterium GW2011_GWA1_49_26]KKW13597.1 MAG: Glutamyl-tRNA(Gln) amidotransferase subunit A [Parcubacteria group bacterium GW2011_GWA2_50_10]OHA61389.1 MAG: glutaminyl-tRNA synthase (glutamine-hyd
MTPRIEKESFTIRQLHEKLVKKEVSAKEIAEEFLERIKREEGTLNAFITQTPELALAQAKEVDEKIASGREIPLLSGVPCAVKDSILVEGVACTAGSKILQEYIAPYDATVTRKLREQGALFVGKTNTDEFNMGSSTENSAFGVTRNPHDPERVAGGTSGGSAAAVAAGEALVALGADTGGSIRLPAAFCGVVGLKPTYGAVSRSGLIAMASSLDQIGSLAQRAQDAEDLFAVICGKDELDATSLEYEYKPLENFALKNLRVGVAKEFFGEGLMPEIAERMKAVLQKLEDAGATVQEIRLPHAKYALAAYYIISTSEVSANLARFDGIRYGKRAAKIRTLLDGYLQSRGEYLGDEVKRRIMLGTYALSAGYYEAYYLKAQKVRTLLQKDFQAAFAKVDVIMGPPSPFLPFKIGERNEDPLAMYLVDLYTVPVNLVGLPALSLPAGSVGNLPVGLQIISKPLEENLLFAVAKELENLV